MNDEDLQRRLADWMAATAPREVPVALLEHARQVPANEPTAVQPSRALPRLGPLAAAGAALAVIVVVVLASSVLRELVRVLRPSPAAVASVNAGPTSPEPSGVLSAPAIDQAGSFPLSNRWTHGFWARRGGDFYVSTDGGTSWAHSTIDPHALAVFVLDPQHAWTVSPAAGSTPNTGQPTDVLHWVVSRTDDGGVSWPVVNIEGNYPDTLPELSFIDQSHGFLVISPQRFSPVEPAVFRTDDGGRSWRKVGTGSQLKLMLTVSDSETLWVGAEDSATPAGDWPLLQVSHNGGSTWASVTLPGMAAMASGSYVIAPPVFLDNGLGFVGVKDRQQLVIFLTTDRGATWKPTAPVPTNGDVSAVAIVDKADWIVPSAQAGALAATADQGATWHDIAAAGLPTAPSWLGFADTLHGAALAPLGDTPAPYGLFVTGDGGHTWRPAEFSSLAPTQSANPSTPPIPSPPPAQKTSTWTPVALPPLSINSTPVGGPGGGFAALPNGGFIDFVVAGPDRSIVLTSPDGTTWAQTGAVTGQDAIGITGPIASNGRVFVALGDEGGGVYYGPQRNGAAWLSSDLRQWTKAPVQAAFGGLGFEGIAGGPDGFVAIGILGGTAWIGTSPDGLHWTQLNDLAFSTDWLATGIVHTPNGYVMVGRSGDEAASWTSPDGQHWTVHSPLAGGLGTLLNGIADGSAGFVSLGSGPPTIEVAPGDVRGPVAAWISQNGASWRGGPSSPALFGADASVVGAPGGYVAAGTVGTDPGVHLWTSTDGLDWIPVAGVSLGSIDSIQIFSDGSHVLLSGHGATSVLLVSSGVDR